MVRPIAFIAWIVGAIFGLPAILGVLHIWIPAALAVTMFVLFGPPVFAIAVWGTSSGGLRTAGQLQRWRAGAYLVAVGLLVLTVASALSGEYEGAGILVVLVVFAMAMAAANRTAETTASSRSGPIRTRQAGTRRAQPGDAKLVLLARRRDGQFLGRHKPKVYIDGIEIGEVPWSEHLAFSVTPGTHELAIDRMYLGRRLGLANAIIEFESGRRVLVEYQSPVTVFRRGDLVITPSQP